MRKNIFKERKIFYLVSNRRFDGSHHKLPKLFVKEFGVISGDKLPETDIDLGVCQGDTQTLYKEFTKRGIPYLLVENDICSFRFGLNERTYAHDKELIENASAVLFTSEGYIEYFKKLEKKYQWHVPEYMVIHNKPLKEDITFIPKEKIEGLNLVVDGGLQMWERENDPYHYKAYLHIFSKFIEAGWAVHLYPTKFSDRGMRLKEYRDIGCRIHNWHPSEILYQEMSQYTAGLQGFNSINTPESALAFAHKCRPNKIYDFLGAGIPTIGYNGGDGMEVYRDKWGIVIDDLEPETLKAIPERLKKIKITKKMRYENVLEKERDKFEYIIDVALKEAGKKNRKSFAIDKNPFKIYKNPFERAFPIMVTVENKTPFIIDRLNRAFLPYSISEAFSVDKEDYRQIRAHINLRVREIGG